MIQNSQNFLLEERVLLANYFYKEELIHEKAHFEITVSTFQKLADLM